MFLSRSVPIYNACLCMVDSVLFYYYLLPLPLPSLTLGCAISVGPRYVCVCLSVWYSSSAPTVSSFRAQCQQRLSGDGPVKDAPGCVFLPLQSQRGGLMCSHASQCVSLAPSSSKRNTFHTRCYLRFLPLRDGWLFILPPPPVQGGGCVHSCARDVRALRVCVCGDGGQSARGTGRESSWNHSLCKTAG